MKGYRSCLFTVLSLAIVAQLRLAKLDEKVEETIEENLIDRVSEGDSEKYLHILNNSDIFKTKYTVTDFVDCGMNGVIVDVGNSNTVAKIILDDSDKYTMCKDELILKDLETKKVSYVNTLIEYLESSEEEEDKDKYYYCVLILEKADTDLSNDDIFSENKTNIDVNIELKKENSKTLFRFFGRVIQSFAELHFKAKVLHGDIKPDNIMVNKKEMNNGTIDLIPVIIDFGLRLVNTSGNEKKDEQLRYAPDFRPLEMTGGEKIKPEDEKAFAETWAEKFKNFRYSKDFVEDVYALGKTIEVVIVNNEKYIDRTQCEISKLLAISNQMMQPKQQIDSSNPDKPHALRPNMKVVLRDFISKMNECSQDKPDILNQEFLFQANKSLEELDKLFPII